MRYNWLTSENWFLLIAFLSIHSFNASPRFRVSWLIPLCFKSCYNLVGTRCAVCILGLHRSHLNNCIWSRSRLAAIMVEVSFSKFWTLMVLLFVVSNGMKAWPNSIVSTKMSGLNSSYLIQVGAPLERTAQHLLSL
jgi:hypothetical protein